MGTRLSCLPVPHPQKTHTLTQTKDSIALLPKWRRSRQVVGLVQNSIGFHGDEIDESRCIFSFFLSSFRANLVGDTYINGYIQKIPADYYRPSLKSWHV